MALNLEDKLRGALYGVAIGDGMGAPVEGWDPGGIAGRFGAHDFKSFLPPTHKDNPAGGKGAGRVTDDTLMVEALCRAYEKAGDHMDAYGYERFMVPQMAVTKVWIPEFQREDAILSRLWWPEKYPWLRLWVCNAEPRTAGVGNCVNCGVAMYMLPVGAVNAGDPRGAYHEAAEFAQAHNESYALEAGAVMAAAYAAALGQEATLASVCDAALGLARDGTRTALAAVLAAARPEDPLNDFIAKVRKAFQPYDSRSKHLADDQAAEAGGKGDAERPSRLKSIEELPVALAALKYGGGDFTKTLCAGVRYGRDCDSIAGMACGLYGALHGCGALNPALCAESDRANRRDWSALAAALAQTVRSIFAQDQARFRAREKAFPA